MFYSTGQQYIYFFSSVPVITLWEQFNANNVQSSLRVGHFPDRIFSENVKMQLNETVPLQLMDRKIQFEVIDWRWETDCFLQK